MGGERERRVFRASYRAPCRLLKDTAGPRCLCGEQHPRNKYPDSASLSLISPGLPIGQTQWGPGQQAPGDMAEVHGTQG